MTIHEVKFLADFQPFAFTTNIYGVTMQSLFNWISLYGIAYVVGHGLKMGLGL